MNFFYLFLIVGILIVVLILQFDRQSKKNVDVILRANKNVPPLFMLRSAELKVNAIRSALNAADDSLPQIDEAKKRVAQQLDKLVKSYKNRDIALTAYYAKLGALLISASDLKTSRVPAEV